MKHIRKLTKSNRSYYLIIPKEIIAKYGYREHQKFVIRDKGKGVIEVRDWRNK